MPQSVPEFQALLTGLANELGVRIDRLTPVIGRLNQRELLAFITDTYPQLATPFLAAAGDLTATWYAEQPAGPKAAQFIPEPADLAPVEQLAASGRWAMLQPEPVDALKRSATRAVFQTSTDTVAANAKREKVKWARHASANACGFCRLMATRGAVYNSQAAAGGKYHDGCHCIAVPDRDGSYEPAPYVKQWEQDYVQAQNEGARTPGQIANAMDRIARDRRGPKPPVTVDPLPNVRRTAGRDLTADIAAINPNWKAGLQWQINCTRCAAAIELRARQYDVTAEPKPESVRDNGYASVLSRWVSPDGTPAGQGGGLHATRSSVPAGETLGMSTGSRIWDLLPAKGRGKTNLAKQAADNAVAEWGPGARGFITVEWSKRAGGGAHIFNVENRDGTVVYLDGQSNQVDAAAHWDLIKTTGGSCRIVRTDDLTPTERVMEWTRERTDTDDQLARNKARMLSRLGDRSLSPTVGGPAGGPDAPPPRPYPTVGGAGGPVPFTPDNPPPVTDEVLDHIVVGRPKGDSWTGGHGFGAGRGKTEYPEGWDAGKIRTAIETVLAAPDEIVRSGSTLYFRATYDGVRIEARVRGRAQGKPKLWTAYPLED